MPVTRYRSVAEMPPPWREPDDPGNLRLTAWMLAWYRKMGGGGASRVAGVHRYRSVADAARQRG